MAQQDVRYFFNGMLFEFETGGFRIVATNGQRLAMAECAIECTQNYKAVVPRKAVLEILRVLKGDRDVEICVNRNHLVLVSGEYRLVTKLIDADFPDYRRAVPTNQPISIRMDKLSLRSALARISIVSNELYRNVKLALSEADVCLTANNPEQEEAEEHIEVGIQWRAFRNRI